MLYNIFKKLTRKKQKPEKTPLIIADVHEKNSLILSELKSSTAVRLEIKSLKIADYLIGDTAIERKTVSDLISSMINKRLMEQLFHMKKYKKSFLIIEGDLQEVYKEESNMAKAIRGLIVSIISNHMPIIFTKDHRDTAKYLITLTKQQMKTKNPVSFHARIPKTTEEQKKYILESFPNIGPQKAKKLIEKFNNLETIFNTSEEDLKEILKNQAKAFKDLLKI